MCVWMRGRCLQPQTARAPTHISIHPSKPHPLGPRVVDAHHHRQQLPVLQPPPVDERHRPAPRQRQRQQSLPLREEAAATVHPQQRLQLEGPRHLRGDGRRGGGDVEVGAHFHVRPVGDVCGWGEVGGVLGGSLSLSMNGRWKPVQNRSIHTYYIHINAQTHTYRRSSRGCT